MYIAIPIIVNWSDLHIFKFFIYGVQISIEYNVKRKIKLNYAQCKNLLFNKRLSKNNQVLNHVARLYNDLKLATLCSARTATFRKTITANRITICAFGGGVSR